MITHRLAVWQPEIKHLHCADLQHGALPVDPSNCAIYMEARIGLKGEAAADTFGFTVITPTAICGHHDRRWHRGYLVLPRFSWGGIDSELQRLLAKCHGTSWLQICEQLNQTLLWEYDRRKP